MIISFVAEAMLEPQLIAWYQAQINALTLDQYLDELAKLVLEKNWAHKIRDAIISSKQGDCPFIDWKIELEISMPSSRHLPHPMLSQKVV